MKFLFSLLSFFLIPTFCYAQITIEEKVEIDPQIIQSYNPTQTHSLQLDLQWDTPQYDVTIVGAVVPCQSVGADWQNGGQISLTIDNAMAGFYRLQPRFNTPSGVTTNVTYQLYFDGSLIIEGTRAVPGGYVHTFPHFNIEYTPPLVSNFSLILNNIESCILTPTSVTIPKYDDCATGYSWIGNAHPVNLTFISGGEFASFYNGKQQMIGDNFSGSVSEFQDIVIIQDSVYRGTADMYFRVQCEWGGMVKTNSVKLLTQTGDVIVVEPYGADDTLYTGEEISLDLYPNDFGGACLIFFPFEVTYSAEILTGNEYGNLLEPDTGIPVQSFTGLGHWFGMSGFDYLADGISPDVLETVTIRVSTSDPSIPYTDFTLYIKPPPIYVYTEPDVVGAADTANVIIKHRLEDGTLEDFPPEQTFELAVLDGCVNGNFMVGTDINVYFADAQQPIKFVTADSLESDSGYVRLRVGTDVGGFMRPISNIKGEEEKQLAVRQREFVGNTGYTRAELRAGFEKMMDEKRAERLALKNKTGADPPLEVPIIEACYLGESTFTLYWEGNAKYEDDKTIEILLGETKYFGVKKKLENGTVTEIKIEEIEVEEGEIPAFPSSAGEDWEWITTDVWGENPISAVECDNCGTKSGTYWENKYSKFGNRTYENGFYTGRNFIKMEDLISGLIRVIGRYWSPDSTYKAKLKAVLGNNSTYIKIKVIKPGKLLDADQNPALTYYVDVNDNVFNIDSICILYGGKLGIPPHFIKGHAFREAARIDFGGQIGTAFTPSFRYEPYTVQYYPNLEDASGRFYFKDTASVDYSDVPLHDNVHYMDYIREVKTVWNMIEDYSQLVKPNNPTQYGKRNDDHTMDFYRKLFPNIQKKYDKFLSYYEGQKKLTRPASADSANVAMVKWFKEDWIKYGTKTEPEKKIAHTRAASSYGLLQMLYTTALWKLKPYIRNKVPEEMNENVFLYLSLLHQKNNLKIYLSEDVEIGNNWDEGFEMSYIESIYNTWNESIGYGKDIVKKSTKFLPK